MDRHCARCAKLTTDDRLVRCQFCGSLFSSLGDDEPYPLSERQENRIYERLRYRLKVYVFGGFSILAVISGVFLLDSMISAYNRGTEFLNRVVLDRVTDQFRDPNIKKTVSQVASTEAKQLLTEQIEPEVARFQKETRSSVDSFRSFTESLQSRYASDYSRIAKGLAGVEADGRKAQSLTQGISATVSKLEASTKEAETLNRSLSTAVDDLRHRKAVADLGVAAVTEADRQAFSDLSAIADSNPNPEIQQLALSEVMRVKAFWVSISRTNGGALSKDGKAIRASDLKTCEVIEGALHNSNWKVRAILTQELGQRRAVNVAQTLLAIIENDKSLEVVKNAVTAWSSLTGYRSPDVFDSRPVADWWAENRASFEKGLAPSEACQQ